MGTSHTTILNDYFGARLYDSDLGRWTIIDPLWEKYYGWSPYNYCLNNPLTYLDPNGMLVYIDNKLNAKLEDDNGNSLLDENGNPINFNTWTNEQKQIYYFQKWWKENGANVEKLFGKGGKYESTDIHFILGTQPGQSYIFNRYDALTTWGNKFMNDKELFRGREEIKLTKDFGIDPDKFKKQPVFKIWFNPDVLNKTQSPPEEEWRHIQIIFNHILDRKPIPNGADQHNLMKNMSKYKIK